MANEFIARNGLIALNSSQITGSFNVSAGITGSLQGTASYATQALSASYAPGGSGTVTSISASGTVSGIVLGGGPITSTGTLTLSGTISGLTNTNLSGTAGITNANLANSSVTVGSTAISLGSSATTLAGLASVTSTNFIGTASLATTASYVLNAVSASYAPSAATFPYTGSAIITGSLQITGSLFMQDDYGKTNIDSSNRRLHDAGPLFPPGAPSVLSIDWGSRSLVRSTGLTSVDWEGMTLNRTSIPTLNWGDKIASDGSTSSSIKWETRELWDADPLANGYNTASLDWNNRYAYDLSAVTSINWNSRFTYDRFTSQSMDWDSRQLNTPNTTIALTWTDNTTLSSDVYQRDFKTAVTQDAVSSTINNAYVSYLGDVIEVDGTNIHIDNTVTDGMLVYLDDTTDTWYPVVQSTVDKKLVGIACNVGFGAGWVLLEGHVVIDDLNTSAVPYVEGAGYGLPVFISGSTTSGHMSTTPPTGGGNVSVMGHCYYKNTGASSQWMMKFKPNYR